MDYKNQHPNKRYLDTVDWENVYKKSRLRAITTNGMFFTGIFLVAIILLLAIIEIIVSVGGWLAWIINLILILVYALITISETRNKVTGRLIVEGKIIHKHEEIVSSGGRGGTYKKFIFDMDVTRALLITSKGDIQKLLDDYSEGTTVSVPFWLYEQQNEPGNSVTLVCLPNRRALGKLQDFQ